MINIAALQDALVLDIRPAVVCQVAKAAEETFSKTFIDRDSIVFGWRDRLKTRIYTLKEKCSAQGWDGENAIPMSDYAVVAAAHFIDFLPEGVKEPFITAENTGDIAFDWDLGEDMTFAVIVSGNHATYAGIFGDSTPRSTERIHGELPIPIKDILLKYFKK